MSIFSALFKKPESLIAIDLGTTGLKLVELDTKGTIPKLVNIILSPLTADLFANNAIKNKNAVAEKISSILEANGISGRYSAIAIPGPSVFTKRLRMSKVPQSELASMVQLEAGNLIPHSIDAVKLDYHVIGEAGKNQIEVLVVAAKNEVVESFTDALSLASLSPQVLDVDYFALQNCFELAYPELLDKRVALINIGARYSSVNICHNGESLFTGDISIGGRTFSEALAQALGCDFDKAENLKKKPEGDQTQKQSIRDALDRKVDSVASEFNRQLSLYWSSLGTEGTLDRIFLSGGGSLTIGLLDELKEKTGISCDYLDPLKTIDAGVGFDASYLRDNSPFLAIAVGLGIRQVGDKSIPNY